MEKALQDLLARSGFSRVIASSEDLEVEKHAGVQKALFVVDVDGNPRIELIVCVPEREQPVATSIPVEMAAGTQVKIL